MICPCKVGEKPNNRIHACTCSGPNCRLPGLIFRTMIFSLFWFKHVPPPLLPTINPFLSTSIYDHQGKLGSNMNHLLNAQLKADSSVSGSVKRPDFQDSDFLSFAAQLIGTKTWARYTWTIRSCHQNWKASKNSNYIFDTHYLMECNESTL